MKFHGIEMRGKFVHQKVATLPVWQASDEGRMIYVEDVDQIYYGTATGWKRPGTGAVGGGDDEVFLENDQTVTTNYTITVDKNALSAGPITVADGVTVELLPGSTWTVV